MKKARIQKLARLRHRAFRHVDILKLTGPQLLRVILHQPKVWERWSVCRGCGAQADFIGFDAMALRRCAECGVGICEPLDAAWWAQAAGRMRAAYRRDRRLIPALKAEWQAMYGDVALPAFPPPFAWLNEAWKSNSARGRPLTSVAHFELAHAVGRFQAAGVSLNKLFAILSEADRIKRRQLYDRLPASSRRFLGDDMRRQLDQLPIVSAREELRRRLRWARRQWTEPIARLSGERVRSRRGPRT